MGMKGMMCIEERGFEIVSKFSIFLSPQWLWISEAQGGENLDHEMDTVLFID